MDARQQNLPQPATANASIVDIHIIPRDIDAEIQKAKLGRMALEKLLRELLVPGVDYDRIPGTDKPTLLKSGAEILCQVFHLSPGKMDILHAIEDYANGFLSYHVGVPIYHRPTGILVAYGIGAANSKEPKYRYRKVTTDEGEQVKTENPDPFGEQNTLIKMAAKRAFVDGVLKATGASRMFTQDVEDYVIPERASKKQIDYLRSLYKGKTEADSLAEISSMLQREIESWNDITREEASKVIDMKKSKESATTKKQTIPDAPKPKNGNGEGKIDWQSFWASAKALGYNEDEVHAIACEVFNADLISLKNVIPDQKALNNFLSELARRKKNAKAATGN